AAEHGVVPDRGALLDRHVADDHGSRRDECGGMNPRALALEAEQWHGLDPRSMLEVPTSYSHAPRQEEGMPFPKIAAVATATPPHRFTQAQLLALAGYRDEERSGFFRRSDIEGRYLWIDPATFRPNESVDELSARFREGALELGESAARRALVIAVEICSAAYFLDDRLESAVAHAIFADGAGALAITTDGPGPSIVAQRTLFRSEHLDAMGFEYPGGRPRVVLSKDVRRIGAVMMGEMA